MKIKKLEIENFKRFTNLTINLGDNPPKLVVLVGPNGCGKSSIFDSFEQIGGRAKPGFSEDVAYLRKNQSIDWTVVVSSDQGIFSKHSPAPNQNFYIRSSYRYDPDFRTDSIQKKDQIIEDRIRPKRMIELDKRVQDNYERLVGVTVNSLYSGDKDNLTVEQLREELIGKVRTSMDNVFSDLILESIGNPLTEGQFFFSKGNTKHFPYKNLSAGEKGAFDILFDLIIKTQVFNNTIIAIDEPELHMHSSLQRSLLKEIFSLIPDNCQLWVATHSIGFVRGSVELLRNFPGQVSIVDFTKLNCDEIQMVKPTEITTDNIRNIFSVAVEDLSSMLVPSRIIFCEGSLCAPDDSGKKEFDTKIYNKIFRFEDVNFISADCKPTAQKSATLLLTIINNTGCVRSISSIVDRDNLTVDQINQYKQQDSNRHYLNRKTIENYLFDSEIIDKYCSENNLDKSLVTVRLKDPINEDVKAVQSSIMQQCCFSGNIDDFKTKLAGYILPNTSIYSELKRDVGL